jgi:hypothetical protein
MRVHPISTLSGTLGSQTIFFLLSSGHFCLICSGIDFLENHDFWTRRPKKNLVYEKTEKRWSTSNYLVVFNKGVWWKTQKGKTSNMKISKAKQEDI